VQWTLGAPEHDVNIDLIIGAWGEGTGPQDRVLVSVLYRPSPSGGSFMVVDAESRFPRIHLHLADAMVIASDWRAARMATL
jgi:hypothetical protein